MPDPSSETILRLGVFLSVLSALALAETVVPRRALIAHKWRRWLTNFALIVIDTAILKLVFFQMLAVGFAGLAAQRGWGLFNILDWPVALEVVICVIALDFAIYLQHVAMHKFGLLWALHKVHHADRDVDVTTAVRFHPLEIVFSMAYKFAVIAALGPAALAVLLFEILLNALAMFTHSNIVVPLGFDRAVRTVFVTPDMHRIHHSVVPHETDSNYGFNLAVWDRLFKTYTHDPELGHENMTLGLKDWQSDAPVKLGFSLRMPFLKDAAQRPGAAPRTPRAR